MNTSDISPLVKGVLVIIGLAIALGQYPRLSRWARSQAIQSMEWNEGLPYFFEASGSGNVSHQKVVRHLVQKRGRHE